MPNGLILHRRIACFLALMSFIGTSASHAQDIQHYHSALGTVNYMSVDGARVADPNTIITSALVNYASNPLIRRNADGSIVTRHVSGLTTFELMAGFALNERTEVGLLMPFGFATKDSDLDVDDGSGLGDIRVLPKFVLLGAGRDTGLGVAVAVPMSFPTEEDDHEFSARDFQVVPKLILEFRARWWRMALNSGYRWLPTRDDELPALALGNGATFGGALGIKPGTDRVEFVTEVFGTVYNQATNTDDKPNPLEVMFAAKIAGPHGFGFTIGGGGGLNTEFSSPEFRVLGGLTWSHSLIPNPRGAAISYGDSDNDGVKDDADRCMTSPEDKDNFQDSDGCPDADNDGDAILDVDDKCPNSPEDKDGFQDKDGCPDIDNDGDGIVDAHDKCPNHPEIRDGRDDQDGCPDDVMVVVERDKIRHLQKIYFETGKAIIRKESFVVLDQVAAAIQANPDIEEVLVAGHTDAHGTDERNDRLSMERATAVLGYLTRAGIQRGRLKAQGFGERKLVGDGLSEENAHLSRRVEFVINKRKSDNQK